ncbi:hypothetical protein METBIDRAFT_31892 [Metschnikowia bicuspidata var. bicuspidata NRRL YB-4993]|uniref:Uncharacterized protein n=1 Tax=Metschnikowia bicuspidata var. bicuspidata NRRL YB-4993 TaxID=869754 RepID=A0A1A0HBF8_9ASCO|nr:hypothetical protein METBIDRAFT_31892 [Metschnikowia bicuspidata var. bicuspidata NRRL YB-4993]OBA21346.1 hypothetical protein METBIDRAFT_31892 [Metschnikowia bicuspidata var. bicuspidata NRRL YB-4993]
MLPSAVYDRNIMKEHAYYERALEDASSRLIQKEWILVLVLCAFMLCFAKAAYCSFKRHRKRAGTPSEQLV